MTILYEYYCENCNDRFDEFVDNISLRDEPCSRKCRKCKNLGTIKRAISCTNFTVPEGSCGNAANCYSSYYGDSEIAKAKGTARESRVRKELLGEVY